MTQHCCGVWTNIFTPFGGIGVAIFLLLSGYGLTESYKKNGLDGWIKKKLIRVWIPYCLFSCFTAFLREDFDFIKLLLNVFSIHQTGYWYVHYLLRCYFVWYLSYRFVHKYRWFVFLVFSIYSFAMMGNLRAEQVLSFPLGIWISENRKVLENAVTKRMALLLICLCAVIGIGCLAIKQMPLIREEMGTLVYSAVELGIKLPLGCLVILMLWLLPRHFVQTPCLILCGTLSYELYLIHMWLLKTFEYHCAASALMILMVSTLMAYAMSKATTKLTTVL